MTPISIAFGSPSSGTDDKECDATPLVIPTYIDVGGNSKQDNALTSELLQCDTQNAGSRDAILSVLLE